MFITGRSSLTQARGFFLAFMRFRDEAEYNNDHQFTDAELNAITPNCILRYFKFKAYGNPEANAGLQYPTFGRHSSLQQYKKSISKFMLSDSEYQDDIKRGNPTKSKRVNALCRTVRQAEVAGKGAPSHGTFRRKFYIRQVCLFVCSNYYLLYRLTPSFFSSISAFSFH